MAKKLNKIWKNSFAIATVGFGIASFALWSKKSNFALSSQVTQQNKLILDTSTVNSLPEEGELPIINASLTFAPNVPPPVNRNYPVQLRVEMNTTIEVQPVSLTHKYEFWTFNRKVPGPLIRARVGDTLEVVYTNNDVSGMAHNIDFHGVSGPGGGAELLLAEQGETKTAYFKLLYPGLFIYHCAAAPVPVHIANGMYGLLLVEPEEGLPKVDREFYVMQSEIYGEPSSEDPKLLWHDYSDGLNENPRHVVFNGKVEALTENPLQARTGERVRIFFGNAGPNLISSFHIIGTIMDIVYREADLLSPPARGLQTTLVPAGGASIIEFDTIVPGTYTLIDHSIFRIDKGAIGFLKVSGDPRPDVFSSQDIPKRCPGCKLHS